MAKKALRPGRTVEIRSLQVLITGRYAPSGPCVVAHRRLKQVVANFDEISDGMCTGAD